MSSTEKHIHHQLIESCRKGDRRAQFELYRAYHQMVFSVCRHFLPQSAEAEEMMQETFLKAYRMIHQFRGDAGFGSWLKSIAIRMCLDHLNRKNVDWLSWEDKFEENLIQENVDQATADWQIDQVRKAIDALPDGYRVIVSLYLLEGYDHEEIAGWLKISPSTSRSQFTRAKLKLREQLKSNIHV